MHTACVEAQGMHTACTRHAHGGLSCSARSRQGSEQRCAAVSPGTLARRKAASMRRCSRPEIPSRAAMARTSAACSSSSSAAAAAASSSASIGSVRLGPSACSSVSKAASSSCRFERPPKAGAAPPSAPPHGPTGGARPAAPWASSHRNSASPKSIRRRAVSASISGCTLIGARSRSSSVEQACGSVYTLGGSAVSSARSSSRRSKSTSCAAVCHLATTPSASCKPGSSSGR